MLQRPRHRVGGRWITRYIEGRRVVRVNQERGCVLPLGQQQAVDEGIDLADMGVGAGRVNAIAICRGRRTADKMVVFVCGNDEQRIVLGDAVSCKPCKELAESRVVDLELLDVGCFTRTKRAFAAQRWPSSLSWASAI